MVPSLSQTSAASGTSSKGLGITSFPSKTESLSPAMVVPGNNNNLLNFASPNAMAAALEGMMANVASTPGMVGMVGMQDLSRGGKRDEDAERRRRVVSVLHSLGRGAGMGRISDEGVRRVGQWAGFDVEIEGKWQGKEHEGNRPVVIAGRNAVLIDLAFRDNRVRNVEVTFASEEEGVVGLQAGTAEVLKGDLKVEGINDRLDRFAKNLEALGRLDKLSSAGVNCVEAVAGVHASLKRLFENEKKAAEALLPEETKDRERKAVHEVVCKKSGRPRMHAHRRVGLSLDYWIGSSMSQVQDTNAIGTTDGKNDEHEEEIYSVEITVEAGEASTFAPIRVSKDWISEAVVKPATENSEEMLMDPSGLDWLEPPQTLLSNPQKENNPMATADSIPSALPDVRFVARLHPPIVMPYTVASQLLETAGQPSAPTVEHAASYEATLLGRDVAANALKIDRPVRDSVHRTALYVPKQELAFTLSTIPFAHPRRIIEILPVLRQWACLGRMLRLTFPRQEIAKQSAAPVPTPSAANKHKRLALDALLVQSPASNNDKDAQSEVPVDISLATGGTSLTTPMGGSAALPGLGIFFPLPSGEAASLALRIAPGAEVSVSATRPGDTASDEVPARALAVVGWDLGMWIEWIRSGGAY